MVAMAPNEFSISHDPNGESSSYSSTGSCKIDNDSPSVTNERVPSSPQLNFSRLAYNLPAFNEQYEISRSDPKSCGRVLKALRPKCSHESFKKNMKSLFPITDWLWNYNWKDDFISDLIAGITIAVFQVPQSMGYSLLSKVPPVYGLYTSFFPALIYSFMGSSRHNAVGTFAVVSLMTGSIIAQITSDNGYASDNYNRSINSTEVSYEREYSESDYAIVITFLIGIYQLIFSIFRLGFVSVYMSEQLISSFITASAVYVLTSQMGYLTGLTLKYHSGPLALFYTYYDLFSKISDVNVNTLIISGVSIVILLIFKVFLNDKIKKHLRVNIAFPIDLIVVIVGTVISYMTDLSEKGVSIVDTVPMGIPSPMPPKWSLIGQLWLKCIPLSVVAFAITYSTGKTFAAHHKYEIRSNQELLAIGTTNIVGSFFSCLPAAASLSRSAVQETSGGMTQMVSLINCVGILAVLLYFGAFLEKLPRCILAAIIAVALKTLLLQCRDAKRYYKLNKLDGSIWVVTFVAVILLDVDTGLYVGITYSLLTLIYKSQRPKTYLLGSIDHTDVYVPINKYLSSNEIEGIKIYQFCGPLHFANVEYFKKGLIMRTKVSVNAVNLKQKNDRKRHKKHNDPESGYNCCGFPRLNCTFNLLESPRMSHANDTPDELPTHIIIDCSMFSYIDTAGVRVLKSTIQDYESIGIKTYIASCAAHVVTMLEKDGGFYGDVPPHHLFITIHDAVHHALDDQRNLKNQIRDIEAAQLKNRVHENNNKGERTTDSDGGNDSPELR